MATTGEQFKAREAELATFVAEYGLAAVLASLEQMAREKSEALMAKQTVHTYDRAIQWRQAAKALDAALADRRVKAVS